MNGYECVQFEKKDRIGVEQTTQSTAVPRNCSATVKGGSGVPRKNGKATHFVPDQTKPRKKVSRQKQVSHKSKESMWGSMNKYAYQPKAHAP